MSPTDVPIPPSAEQAARAKYDLVLADIEFRQEQLRASRQDQYWKAWQVLLPSIVGGITAIAAAFAAGAAFVKLMSP